MTPTTDRTCLAALLIVTLLIAACTTDTTPKTVDGSGPNPAQAQTEEMGTAPVTAPEVQDIEPGLAAAAAIPMVQTEWYRLGPETPAATGGSYGASWIIPTNEVVYAVNGGNYTTWQFKDGTWEELGTASYKERAYFQVGELTIPAELGAYAGAFLITTQDQYEQETTNVLVSILGEKTLQSFRFASTKYSWRIVLLARDSTNHEITAALVWQLEEIGRPVPPTPRLYLSTDNQQTWTEINLGEAEKFQDFHPYKGLAVRQSEDGAIYLYLAGKGVWYARAG